MKILHVVIVLWTLNLSCAMTNFTDKELEGPMTLITLFQNTTTSLVFVSARNKMYSLDPNLRLHTRGSNGPMLDHPECPAPMETCSKKRESMPNDPRVLGVEGSLVYACGTLFHGMCSVSLGNISPSFWVGMEEFRLSNLVAGRESTAAVFVSPPVEPAPYMYVATTYDGRPLEYVTPAISKRYIYIDKSSNKSGKNFHFSYASDSEFHRPVVNFDPKFVKSYKVNYVYGFEHKGFVYFVTTQRASVISEIIETRLVRVCSKDIAFFSYTEIALKCHRGDAYNLATTATLGPAGPLMRTRLKMDDSIDVLYITFAKTVLDHSDLVDKSKGTVMCSFPMSQVVSYFTNATRDCFNAEPGARLLTHVVGVDQKCKNHSNIEINDDFCGSGLNHYIEGREAIPGGVRAYVDNHVTSLAVTLQRGKTVAFLGTEKGDVIKMMLERSNAPLYVENIASSEEGIDRAIQKSNVFDSTHEFLYLLTGNKVVKFPAGSCSLYKSCGSCLASEDPLDCGWCGTYCANYNDCEAQGLFSRDTCGPKINNVQPTSGPTAGGTVLTITGDNFSSSESREAGSHIQVRVAGFDCEIILWTPKKLQCKTIAVPQEVSGPVEIRVSDHTWALGQFDMNGTTTSSMDFHYLVPLLSGGFPKYGVVSGSTSVRVYGQNLGIGSSQSIIVAGVKCQNITVHPVVKCLTAPSNKPVKGPFEMMIDDAHIIAKGNFLEWKQRDLFGKEYEYKPDPIISNVYPKATTISGTSNITVIGEHLNSVYAPMLKVVMTKPITGKRVHLHQPCTVLNSTVMRCPTPPFNDTDFHTPSERAPVLSYMLFLFDGSTSHVDSVENIRDLPQLLYYPDPEYFPFEVSPKEVTYDQTELEINGKNIDLANSPNDVKVLIDGSVSCNVFRMSSSSLGCAIPDASLLPESNSSLHSVEVLIHPLKFYLGTIKFVEGGGSSAIMQAVIIIIILLFISVVGMLIIFFMRKYMKRKSLGYMTAYTADNGNLASNDYDSCGARPSVPRRSCNSYAPTERALSVTSASNPPLVIDEETVRLLDTEKLLIGRNCLTLVEIVGEGNFGCVYHGMLSLPGKEPMNVAVKTLRQSGASQLKEEAIQDFIQEGLMMKDFKHPNILGLIGVCLESTSFPMVITPYMKYGDLHTYIGDEERDPNVLELLNFGIDIAKGMSYLASMKFVHRDLAARNCMLGEDMVVRVADFGLSRDIYEREYYCSDNKKKLPIKWMAIECLEKGTYTSSTDVWSYGVVLWELMTRGVLPYPEVDNWDMLNFLKSGRRMFQPYCCPDLVYNIMLRCWQENPTLRPTFDELVEDMKSAVTKYEEDNREKQQKVGLSLKYVNCPIQYACNVSIP